MWAVGRSRPADSNLRVDAVANFVRQKADHARCVEEQTNKFIEL